MTQIERLKFLYTILNKEALSKNEIREKLNHQTSIRQIDRDLIDLRDNYLRNDETLLIKVHTKRKYYAITKKKYQENKLNFDDFAVIDFLMVSDNSELFKKFKKQTNLLKNFKTALFDVYGENQSFIKREIVNKTGFYELKNDETFIDNIILVYKAIYEEKKIDVEETKFDATSENPELKITKLKLKPLKIMYHRGDFYLCSIFKKKFKVFEIGQLKTIKICDEGFNWEIDSKIVDVELPKRFGISNNIDSKIYDIKLQFSEATGSFVSKFRWHHSQNKITLDNKNYIIEFKCGINRELVGWIYQWMNNVKIIEPQKLIDIYEKTNKSIINLKTTEKLQSVNHFEFKE